MRRCLLFMLCVLISAPNALAEVVPLFTEDLDAFDARQDIGDGELHGVDIIPAAESPFNDGDAFRIFDFNTGDKPELQGEFLDPFIDEPFRIDFQSFNQSVDESSSAIRFRLANSGKNVGSEGRVAFSLSWQADGRFTAKYEREDGTVGTKGIFLPSETVSEITMIANPSLEQTYTYTLFDETRTLSATSYDVFIDELLYSSDFEMGMPFHLTRSADEFDPTLGIQRFGLIGSSNANVDPDYLFDNIILRTGEDISPGIAAPTGDFDSDGDFDAADIDALTTAIRDGVTSARFDLNNDGIVNTADRTGWVVDVKQTWFGDANLDGEFNSGDFVQVFSAGEYEDAVDGNSTWATGDWNGDGDFNSGDFVVAFGDGGFEIGPRNAVSSVPEPSGLGLVLAAMMTVSFAVRRNRANS